MQYTITRIVLLLVGLLCFGSAGVAAADSTAQNPGITILCYHDVGKLSNEYATSPATLDAHFSYLKEHGFTPISFERYVAINKGLEPLPPKAVLLTFDDGYQSLYTEIFPLLKKYNYPALMAIVTSWPDNYAPAALGPIVSWQQLREMEASGLVSYASHSHDSHRFLTSNPQGDGGKMLESRAYKNGRYESDDEFRQRVKNDFEQSQAVFRQQLGHSVHALVWPFGAYSGLAREIGREVGFDVFFGLDGKFNPPGESSLSDARRGIIMNNPSTDALGVFLKNGGRDPFVVNAAQLDLDMIFDPKDATQTEHNLDLAIERFNSAKINTVFLQAFSDPNGDGNVPSVYFHTDKAPVKADLFSHVSNKLSVKGFTVFAWVPTLANQWHLAAHPDDAVIATPPANQGWYKRASPFSPRVRQAAAALVSDLAAYSYIDGILFQDDLYLNDFEDFSPAAAAAFQRAFNTPLTSESARGEFATRWMKLKTAALDDVTADAIRAAQQHHPNLLTARNLYPTLITQPESEEWFAQNFADYLSRYDYTVVMAYPYLEKQHKNPLRWLEELTQRGLTDRRNADKLVFKLQTYDWNAKRWLSPQELWQQQRAIKGKGGIHFAYYPENVFSEE